MVFGSRIRIVRYYYFFGKKRILNQNTLFISAQKDIVGERKPSAFIKDAITCIDHIPLYTGNLCFDELMF